MSLSLIMLAGVILGFILNFFLAKALSFPELARKTGFAYFTLLSISLLLVFLDQKIAVSLLHQIDGIRFYLILAALFMLLHLLVKSIGLLFFDYLFAKRMLSVPRLLKDVVMFILYLAGILLIINFYLDIRITVFLASSAVLTIVIGLALQDILGNIFSGMILNFERILKQNDWIEFNGHEGQIVQLGWRSIVIRDLDHNRLIIPNQSASKSEIRLFGDGPGCYFLRMEIGAGYRHAPDFVIANISEVLDSCDSVLKNPPYAVYLLNYDQSAIIYQIKYAIRDYTERNRIASEIRRKLWYAFKRGGIEIPFPIRNVYMRQDEARTLSVSEKIEILGRIPILQVLDAEKFSEIAEKSQETLFGKGELIIREGSRSPFFYQVVSGEVEVIKNRSRVARLSSRDFFGEISIVTGEAANASVVAIEETRLLAISAELFRNVVEMNHELAEKFAEVIVTRRQETSRLREENASTGISKSQAAVKNRLMRRIIQYFGIH
ncbi:MAG: mechanosensitive ion channel family protein [Acidobacteriota bacterium]|nr:mechanosensitive ion channel family protein [Acidobacteriota bacterium]